MILEYADADPFPITPCVCSLKEGARTKVRGFLQGLAAENPHIYSNLISAGVKVWKGRPASEAALVSIDALRDSGEILGLEDPHVA
jgi:hypothetical protein